MNSSIASPFPPFLATDIPTLLRRRSLPLLTSSSFLLCNSRCKNPTILRLSACLAEGSNLELSWFPPDPNALNDCSGWAILEASVQKKKKQKGLGAAVASFGLLTVLIAGFWLSRKAYVFQPKNLSIRESKSVDSGAVSEASSDYESITDSVTEIVAPSDSSASMDKLERVVIPVAVDSTQQEALSVLKKLKIIEDDVRADELCTRKEYARWLVRLNSLLERNPKRRIVPSVSLSGSVTAAFDDVGIEDPDFAFIQSLAEAGIIPSKLVGKNSHFDSSKGQGGVYFYPERFISRWDLMSWKTQLEYVFVPGIIDQISRMKVDYMDVKEISADESPELFMDMLAGDKSILRKVFGQSRRFQPNKPSTKAQAAVTLTSGRMSEAIYAELLRMETESSSRQAAMEEIRSELIDRGDIRRYWDGTVNEERCRGFEVEKHYHAAIHDLEAEKITQEKSFAEHLKEKAAMDCQRQLLSSLKEEVVEMSERLASERAMYVSEKCNVQEILSELQNKQEGMLDTKSILEVEKEAIRILRSWVEDEARKNQARAKVLEEVGRRWKWDNHD